MHAAMQNDVVSVLAVVSRAGPEQSLHVDTDDAAFKTSVCGRSLLVPALHYRALESGKEGDTSRDKELELNEYKATC